MRKPNGWIQLTVPLLLIGFLFNCVGLTARAQEAPATTLIRVGFYNNPPKIFRDDKGNVTGFFPEMLAAIAAREGWQIEYVSGTWSECLSRLSTGEIDLMPDVAYSEARAEIYQFSNETILVNWGILYVRPRTRIFALTDLANKRIAVMRGSIYTEGEDGIRALLDNFEIEATFVEADDYSGVFQLLDAGKADAGVVNRLFGAWHERAYRVQKTPILFNSQQLRFASSPVFANSEYVLSRIDEDIIEMKNDPGSVYYTSLTETLAGGGPGEGSRLPAWAGPLIGGLLGLAVVVAPGVVLLLRHDWRIRLAQYSIRYETLFNQAAAGITVEDMRTRRFFRVNKRFAEMLGYEVNELLALSSEAVTYPGDPVLGDPRWKKFPEGEEDTFVLDKRYVRKNGSTMWASVAFSFLRNDRGEATYGMSVVQDITDRKRLQEEVEQHRLHLEQLVADRTAALRRAHDELEERVRERTHALMASEEALRASEERFRTLFVRAPDAYFLTDLEGTFLDGNVAAEELVGVSKDELIGKNYFQLNLLSERDRKRAFQDISENRRGKATGPTQFTLRRADGKAIPVEIHTYPVSVNGRSSLLSIARDVSLRVEATRRLEEALEVTIGALAATAEQRDRYTAGHQKRVTKLACAIATRMGITEGQLAGLRVASLMHDIGKMAIPAEILSKPGRLSPNELNLIKEHPATAYGILKGIDFPWPVAEIVLQHHEHLDGSGYPRGLKGDEITIEAQILAVADVVEAMSTHRPYRPALGVKAALAEIESKKGILYDANVVDACIEVFSSGEFAFEDQPLSEDGAPDDS